MREVLGSISRSVQLEADAHTHSWRGERLRMMAHRRRLVELSSCCGLARPACWRLVDLGAMVSCVIGSAVSLRPKLEQESYLMLPGYCDQATDSEMASSV